MGTVDPNSFTAKSSEAILSARDIAAQRNHQYVDPTLLGAFPTSKPIASTWD